VFTNLKDLSLMCQDLNLLYVEDDEKTRDSTIHLLNNFFKKITFAINGIDAIHKFKNDKFDLIISDINMPEMNGFDLASKLKTMPSVKSKPIIALTTETSSDMKKKGKEIGLIGWITKPFVSEKLIMGLKRVLKIR